MGNGFGSSTIYETFFPFNAALCFCGFWYNGNNAKSKCASLESFKILLSVLYSLLFVALFLMNVLWGVQMSAPSDGFLLKHGWNKLALMELLYLPIIIWSNYHHRRELDECLQLFDQYDVMCQVWRLALIIHFCTM